MRTRLIVLAIGIVMMNVAVISMIMSDHATWWMFTLSGLAVPFLLVGGLSIQGWLARKWLRE
jgi:hypothetical protein